MFARTFVVNILLALLVVFLGVENYRVWHPVRQKPAVVRQEQKPAPQAERTVAPKTVRPKSDYAVVVDSNLFSPQRKEIKPEEPKKEPLQLSGPGRKIFVYGVVIAPGYVRALVSNPVPKPNERPKKWVKVGDDLADFTVEEIQKDRVILADGTNRYEVFLHDKEKPRVAPPPPVATEAKPTVVTTATTAEPQKVSAQTKQGTPQAKEPEGEFVEVKTPFGTIKRKVKKE
jgi:hypothetical protein